MSDVEARPRMIKPDDVRTALNLVVYQQGPRTVERPERDCGWEVCADNEERICYFPRYSRNGAAVGLTAKILIQLGYPVQLLLDLDREYEMGEILHPGVKIGRSRNQALARIEPSGVALLTFIQERQKLDLTWGGISLQAIEPSWAPRMVDRRRRPWLY